MPLREFAHDETLIADMHAFVVLKPLSHPELSEIRIGKLFTIGRLEDFRLWTLGKYDYHFSYARTQLRAPPKGGRAAS